MTSTSGTAIEADPALPVIRMVRDFVATPAHLLRAHTDPVLFAQWVGPDATTVRIGHRDARNGGSWDYVFAHDGRSRLRTQSPMDGFQARDALWRSGLRTGVDQGYAELERMAHRGFV